MNNAEADALLRSILSSQEWKSEARILGELRDKLGQKRNDALFSDRLTQAIKSGRVQTREVAVQKTLGNPTGIRTEYSLVPVR